MIKHLQNIYRLGIKEIYSLRHDLVLSVLIVFTFTFSVYSVAKGNDTEVHDAAIAVVDNDDSELSRRLRDSFLLPYFKRAELLDGRKFDQAMDQGRFSFIIDIPPNFQADVIAGRKPALQLSVDATAMSLAGNGTTYIETIINRELLKFNSRRENDSELPITLTVRSRFNPNLDSSWFSGAMQVVNNMTMLAIILTGAAVIREREHGTLEHLLVMPVSTFEIMISKIWANSAVLMVAATLSLWFVVRGIVGVPMDASSVALFVLGAIFYLFSLSALGIMLATLATTMPQFGLLSLPICVGLQMLSGGTTSFESMPIALQAMMETMPSPHFVRCTQGVLYRGAGLDAVWQELVAIIVIGTLFFVGALVRFRATISSTQ